MPLGIGVEKAPDHSLILRVVFPRRVFEELDAALAERDRDLDSLVPKDELFRSRQEIRNDSQLPEWLTSVSDSLAHKSPSLSASSQPR